MNGFFSKLKSFFGLSSPAVRAKKFDPGSLQEVASLLSMLKGQRFDDLSLFLEAMDENLRYQTIGKALTVLDQGEKNVAITLSSSWVDAKPSPEAFYAMCLAYFFAGWEYRGEACADDVDEDAWDPFLRHIQLAEEAVRKAIQLAPTHGEPLSMLLHCGRAGGAERDEMKKRFKQLIEVAPDYYRGHLAMLEYLKAKWSGSHEEMFAFARQRVATAPEGSSMNALIVEAHFEIRNLLYWDDQDAEAADYFKQPHIAREVVDAWNRSLGSPRFRDVGDTMILANLFAATFYLAGDKDRCRQALARMDHIYIDEPWEDMAENRKESNDASLIVARVAKAVGMDGTVREE